VSTAIHVVTERQGFFTPKTLAAYLALSERTVRQLLADSAIPSYRIAGSRRIDPRDVDNYLRRCRDGRTLTYRSGGSAEVRFPPAPGPRE
jgi:excisionase family DNA binding protein